MRALTFLFLLVLAGCSDPTVDAAADAERELEIIRKAGGSSFEICKASRRVADAHLKAQDATKYQNARTAASIACQESALRDLESDARN